MFRVLIGNRIIYKYTVCLEFVVTHSMRKSTELAFPVCVYLTRHRYHCDLQPAVLRGVTFAMNQMTVRRTRPFAQANRDSILSFSFIYCALLPYYLNYCSLINRIYI